MENKDKSILRVVRFDNVRIKNTHNGYLYPTQSVLEIDFKDGSFKMLDLFSQKDITDIDYFQLESTRRTKKITIYSEYND